MTLFKRLKQVRLPDLKVRAWAGEHRAGLLRAGKISAGIGALTLVVLLVHKEVYSLVAGRKEYVVTPESLRVALAPKWTGGRNAVDVDLGPDGWSAFDDEAPARVGRAFEKNPWVRRVTSVQREFPNRLRVRYEFRTPHVTVRTGEGWIAVDRDRVRLPGVWKERPPRALEADLVGLGSAPEAGRMWDDPALAAGIETAELVGREPLLAKAGVTAIDVANLGGRVNPKKSEIAMLTSSGCIVYWGRPESSRKFGELTVAQKIGNLRLVLEAYPNLDGLQYAKVYFEKPAVLEKDSRTTDRGRPRGDREMGR
ncbi:MAG: hypothetical protein HYY17_11210 [Planctomycetes bacterium]|nr:hypothetical protein [Planctomycetota bacterium]